MNPSLNPFQLTLGFCAGLLLCPVSPGQEVPATGTVFPASQMYELDSVLVSVAGDVDQDGTPEFALAARVDVLLLREDGTGGLTGSFLGLPNTGEMRTVALPDWNNDGFPDFAVGRKGTAALVHLGDGTGGVTTSVILNSSDAVTRDIKVADMDGDGVDDVVTAQQVPIQALVVRSDGSTGVKSFSVLGTPKGVARVAVTDLNQDGELDVVAAAGALLHPFLADGKGGYSNPSAASIGSAARDLEAIDLDGDGREELVASVLDPDRVLIFTVSGSGTMTLAETYPVGNLPRQAVFADLDSDGDLDMLVATKLDHALEIRLGNGTLDFSDASYMPMSPFPTSVTLTDRDGDGLLDVVVTHAALPGVDADVSLFSSDGVGQFVLPRRFPVAGFVNGSAVIDMDGDGRLDVVAITSSPNQAVVFHGSGQHSLTEMQATTLPPNSRDLGLGDVTGDGAPDLVTSLFSFNGGIAVLANDGNGLLVPNAAIYPTDHFCRSMALADLDSDGLLDVIASTRDRRTLTILSQLPQAGGLAEAHRHYLTFDPGELDIGDINGDGEVDVVVVGDSSGFSSVLLGRVHSLSFVEVGGALPPLQQTVAVELGDLNLDGNLDLAIGQGTPSTAQIRLLLGNGAGAFAQTGVLTTPPVPHDIEIVDVDDDGLVDVLATASNAIMVHRGLPGGGQDTPQMFSTGGTLFGSNLFNVDVIDMNQDRILDVVTGSTTRAVIVIPSRRSPWWNVGGGVPGASRLEAVGELTPGSTLRLLLEGPPFSTVWVAAGLSPSLQPVGGGQLVPQPDVLLPLVIDADGKIHLDTHVPVDTPAGVPLYVQPWELPAGASLPGDAILGVTR